MNQNHPLALVFYRLLAVAHGIVGLAPLLGSAWFGGLVLGRMWAVPEHGVSLRWFLAPALGLLPPWVFGVWMLVLAFRLWRPTPRLAGPLFWTHVMVLLFGGLHCALGIYAVRAAERSTAAGGGLLSPVAFFPFLVGVPLLSLALVSLFAASRLKRLR